MNSLGMAKEKERRKKGEKLAAAVALESEFVVLPLAKGDSLLLRILTDIDPKLKHFHRNGRTMDVEVKTDQAIFFRNVPSL